MRIFNTKIDALSIRFSRFFVLACLLFTAFNISLTSEESGAANPASIKSETLKNKTLAVMSTEKINNLYRTSGYIDIFVSPEIVVKELLALHNYDVWALKGLDGSDPESIKYIGLFKGFTPHGVDKMRVVYDIALVWPLGSTGNIAVFKLVRGSNPGHLTFVSDAGTIAYDYVSFSFSPELLSESCTRVSFVIETRFTWLIDPFMNVASFEKGIGFRAQKIASNLAERCYGL